MTTAPTMAPAGVPTAARALDRARSLVTPALDIALEHLRSELQGGVQHHFAGSGKFVRAGLVLLAPAAGGADEGVGRVGAVAIELVHNFSLLHDDIIDGDIERRHRPTVWAEFGVGQAIISGDALATLALQLLLEEATPERVSAAVALAEATQAMIAGQAEDMASERRSSLTVEECLRVAAGKTGALLSCAASLGAVLAGAPAPAVDALADFGRHLGIAFQAVDDVLGIWGEGAVTGKPVGNDLRLHKKTLPVAIACAAADADPELGRLLAGEMSDSDVDAAASALAACGAREAAMAMGESHLQAALASLERVDLELAPVTELAAIAHFVTARDR